MEPATLLCLLVYSDGANVAHPATLFYVLWWWSSSMTTTTMMMMVMINKNTFENHMTTGFEQKYGHDILIRKKVIKWTGYLNVLYTVYSIRGQNFRPNVKLFLFIFNTCQVRNGHSIIMTHVMKGRWLLMFVDPCIVIQFIQKIQQDATVYQNLLFHIYMKPNMFRATRRPSSGAKNCTSSLWFCIRGRLLDVWLLDAVRQSLTVSSNRTSNNHPCMQNQRLLVQF